MIKISIRKILFTILTFSLCHFAFADTYWGSNDILLVITNESAVPLVIYGMTDSMSDANYQQQGGMELVPGVAGYKPYVNDCYNNPYYPPMSAPVGQLETFAETFGKSSGVINVILPGQQATVHTCVVASSAHQGQGLFRIWGLNGTSVYMEVGDVGGSQFPYDITHLPGYSGSCGTYMFVQAPSTNAQSNGTIPCPTTQTYVGGAFPTAPKTIGNVCVGQEAPQNTHNNWGCWSPFDMIVGGSSTTYYRGTPSAP